MTALNPPGKHEYEPSDDCSNWAYNTTPQEGDEQCAHNHWRSPHCAWCGNRQDAGWHTAGSR